MSSNLTVPVISSVISLSFFGSTIWEVFPMILDNAHKMSAMKHGTQ